MKIVQGNNERAMQALKESLLDRIRAEYTVDEEFRIINAGIADSTDSEYIAYRQFIENLLAEYRAAKDAL